MYSEYGIALNPEDAKAVSPKDAFANGRFVDAKAVAETLGFCRDWVYDHADELGCIRIGDGPKPRCRFDMERVLDFIEKRRSPQPLTQETPARRSHKTKKQSPRRGGSDAGYAIKRVPRR